MLSCESLMQSRDGLSSLACDTLSRPMRRTAAISLLRPPKESPMPLSSSSASCSDRAPRASKGRMPASPLQLSPLPTSASATSEPSESCTCGPAGPKMRGIMACRPREDKISATSVQFTSVSCPPLPPPPPSPPPLCCPCSSPDPN